MDTTLARRFLDVSQAYLRGDFLPKIERTVAAMSDDDLWWRPHEEANSAANLVLHLAGNVRQWIVAGVGGAPDVRHRAAEFAARDGVSRQEMLARLRASVDAACDVLAALDPSALAERRQIQAHDVTVMEAIYHVVEHFSMHTGQIIYLAKLRSGRGMGFYEEAPDGRARLRWKPTPEGPAERS